MNAREFNGALRAMTQFLAEVRTPQEAELSLAKIFDLVLTVEEVAELKGVAKRTVNGWIEKGQIPYFKKGSVVYILKADAIRFTPPPRGNPAWSQKSPS